MVKRQSARTCSRCKKRTAKPGCMQCSYCLGVAKRANTRRRHEKKRNYLCYDCGEKAVRGHTRCQRCLDLASAHGRDYHARLKREVMEHYGGAACACCGESHLLMLTVDHVAQNGGEHRRQLGHALSAGQKFYQWLRREGYPAGYRVLCRNCNYAVYHSANHCCPHKAGVFSEKI